MSTAPQIMQVSATRLTVDATVQRGLDKARVDKMVRDYRDDALGVIVVSHRVDDTMHVIDGQHRVAATIAAGYGDRELTCLVHAGLSRPAEAAMFRAYNNTKAVGPLDRFLVRVVEGDPVAVEITKILDSHGWVVQAGMGDGRFAAVAAIEGVYKGKAVEGVDNREAVELTIQVITKAWGHEAAGVHGEIVSGVGAVLLRYGQQVDLAKLVHELSKHEGGPRTLIGKAKGLRGLRGGRVSDALAEIVVELVNKSRRTNRLPDWRSA